MFFAHDTSIEVIPVFRFLRASFCIAYEAVNAIMFAPRAFTFSTVRFLFPVRTESGSGARRYRTQALQIIVFAAPTFQIFTVTFLCPVLAFLVNPGHGETDTATARPQQARCPEKLSKKISLFPC